MKSDYVKEFVKLQSSLHDERTRIHQRLNEINEALGSVQPPSLSILQGAGSSRKAAGRSTGKRGQRKMSAEARARIAAAARKRWAKAKASGRNRL